MDKWVINALSTTPVLPHRHNFQAKRTGGKTAAPSRPFASPRRSGCRSSRTSAPTPATAVSPCPLPAASPPASRQWLGQRGRRRRRRAWWCDCYRFRSRSRRRRRRRGSLVAPMAFVCEGGSVLMNDGWVQEVEAEDTTYTQRDSVSVPHKHIKHTQPLCFSLTHIS